MKRSRSFAKNWFSGRLAALSLLMFYPAHAQIFVGSWAVDQGPYWDTVPPPTAYSGQTAAVHLFGSSTGDYNPADYSISTVSSNPAQINDEAWYSIIYVGSGAFAQNYLPDSVYVNRGDASAYVEDNAQGAYYTNYAFLELSSAYWLGNSSGLWTGTNWATNSSGTETNLTPTSGTDVTFSASGAAHEATTLGADTTIHSLTIDDPTAVSIGGANTLTVSGSSGTTGITVNSGGGHFTISSNLALAGTSQTISVNNTAGAEIDGSISSSIGLTKSGTGTLTLAGASTDSGNTTIDFGTLAVNGAGASISSPGATVSAGNNSGDNGTLRILTGGQVTDTFGYIGANSGSSGTATVNGFDGSTASTWSNSNSFVVGSSGTGTLTIESGGQVTDSIGIIGNQSGSSGTATVATLTGLDGNAASTWSSSNGLYVGNNGTGTLNIEDEGVVQVGGGAGTLTLAQYSGSTGTLNIGNGGIVGTGGLQAGAVTGGAGTAQVNFGETDSSYTFAPNLTGSLSVTQNGTGTTILTGTNTYTGNTTIDFGTLAVSGAGAGISSSGATLSVGYNSGDNGSLLISNGGQVTGTGSMIGGVETSGIIGNVSGSTGTVTVTGVNANGTVSTWANNSSELEVGFAGTGTLNIENGGQVTDTGAELGVSSGATGTVTVTGVNADGTASTLSDLSGLVVGSGRLTNGGGTGTLNVQDGGQVNDNTGYLGYSAGSSGTATVTGVNASGRASTWSTSADLILGYFGTGTLTIADGGQVSDTGASIGASSGASGTVMVTGVNANGTASTWSTSFLNVGYDGGTGTLNIQDGGQVSDGTGYIGNLAGTSGTATVTGVNASGRASTWSTSADLIVGYFGTGTLTIADGGQVSDTGASIGASSGASGTVTVTGVNANGTTSTWSSSFLNVGYGATGTLNIENGGVVSSPSVTMADFGSPQAIVNLNSNGVLETGSITNGGGTTEAAINFNGGILRATADSSDFISGFASGQVTLGNDGGTIDNNGFAITVNTTLVGTGGLTSTGSGTLTLTAANTYTGNTTVDFGTLAVSGAGAAISGPSLLVYVGYNSGDNGSLLISNGGQVTATGVNVGNSFTGGIIGYAAGSSGTLTVTGVNTNGTASTWADNTSELHVGYQGTGTLNIEDGGQVDDEGANIASGAGSIGTATVSGVNANGTASTWNNLAGLVVGAGSLAGGGGTGTLTVQDGGQVKDNGGFIGYGPDTTGTATVTGVNGSTASTWSNTFLLYVGYDGNGTLNIEKGGVVQVDGGAGTLTMALDADATGTLNIGNGGLAGTLQVAEVNGGAGAAQVNFGETDSSYTFAPELTGNLSVNQTGTGTTLLTGNNTYSNGTTINNGDLEVNSISTVGSAQPLGEGSNILFTGASSSSEGALEYTGGTTTLGQNLTVATGDFGVVDNTGGGVLTLSGAISKNGSVLTLAGGNFVVGGTITGSNSNSDLDIGSMMYPGSATVGLTTSNSYNGPTVITDGSTLLTGVDGALPTSTPTAITLGASTDASGTNNTLDLLGTTQTVASLTSAGPGNNQVISSNGNASTPAIGSGASTRTGSLVVNYSGATPDTFSGSLGGQSGQNNFGVTKIGSGTLTLSGTNTYTGATTIIVGAVDVTGSIVNSSTSVGNGATPNSGTLSGTGSVNAVTVANGGNLSPGDSTTSLGANLSSSSNNILTAASLTLNGGATLTYNLYHLTASTGTSLNPAGSTLIDLGLGSFDAGLDVTTGSIVLNFQNTAIGGKIDSPNVYTLVEFGTTTLTTNDFTLENISASDSSLNFVSLGDGQTALQIDMIPEPSTWVMLLGGLGLLAFWSMRKRRARG